MNRSRRVSARATHRFQNMTNIVGADQKNGENIRFTFGTKRKMSTTKIETISIVDRLSIHRYRLKETFDTLSPPIMHAKNQIRKVIRVVAIYRFVNFLLSVIVYLYCCLSEYTYIVVCQSIHYCCLSEYTYIVVCQSIHGYNYKKHSTPCRIMQAKNKIQKALRFVAISLFLKFVLSVREYIYCCLSEYTHIAVSQSVHISLSARVYIVLTTENRRDRRKYHNFRK